MSKVKILLIEDSSSYADLISEYLLLSSQGFEVTPASSMKEAQELLSETSFDIILSDLNLGDSDGMETIVNLKPFSDKIPLIVLTGMGDLNLAIKSFQEGAEDYLYKDEISPRLLIRSIRYSLERFQMRQKIQSYSERLAEKNAELEKFAYIASHDLSEPLRKVISFGERLLAFAGDKLEDKGRDYLSRMMKATKRMQNLLSDLLKFSRVGGDIRSELKADLCLNSLLEDLLCDLSELIEDAKAEIIVQQDLPKLNLSPGLISELFQNLITNSIKFRKEGSEPKVEISCEEEDEFYNFSIKDNGIGFESEYAERIFEQFQRLHGREVYEGTGMGLSIARRVAEAHGGSLVAVSELGEGAEFILRLPKPKNQKISDSKRFGLFELKA